MANYRGVEFAENETNKYKLESYFASENISIKTTSLGPSFNVITRYFYFNNSGNPVAIEA